MKNYYLELSNGEYDFVEASCDKIAYSRACKIAKNYGAKVTHLAEYLDDEEEGRVI